MKIAEISDRYIEPSSPLSRVLTEAPYLCRCSGNKTAAKIQPRDYAIKHPYMQVNRANLVSWLVFDLDHSNSLAWDDANLPAPNIIVRNPKNGHSHLFYAISAVSTSENSRSHPIAYMKAVYKAFAKAMKADLAYSGPVAKTPGHPWWDTTEIHNKVFDLGDLACHTELEFNPFSVKADENEDSSSRHCRLFNIVRRYGYTRVNQFRGVSTHNEFHDDLLRFALQNNTYRGCKGKLLSFAQVKATVKSIARWTWDKYQYGGSNYKINRGIMGLDPNKSLKDRQTLAAKRSHQIKINNTIEKITIATKKILSANGEITYVAIAKEAKLSRQTVAKYKEAIEKIQREFDAKTNVLHVNFGVNQISSSFRKTTRSFVPQLGSLSHLVCKFLFPQSLYLCFKSDGD